MAVEPRVESVDLTTVTAEKALAIGELLARVWPKPGKDALFRARQLMDAGAAYDGGMELNPRTFIVYDGDPSDGDSQQVIAAATVEPRKIRFNDGGGNIQFTVLALSKVGSDPDRRGQGLGAHVVQAVFGMIDAGLAPFSLFQTSHKVRPFYERLGGCLVENRVVNSLAEDDPEANPFQDEIVMRYPSNDLWPEGTIDLLGPGY